MIYINPTKIRPTQNWLDKAKTLKAELLAKDEIERISFITQKRNDVWGNDDLIAALRNVVGNKCWYSEVDLTGSDPNIDHFRPKGRVKEINNETLANLNTDSGGYWWLAFDLENFRLSSMHSNQRRVDEQTDGGKWDYFPVEGLRALEKTPLNLITEAVLPLDPCSATDVAMMWFGPDGNPGFSNWRRKPTDFEQKRMKITIWLFHLDKLETASNRTSAVEELKISLKNADAIYQIWQSRGGGNEEHEKKIFDNYLADIYSKICDESPFAGAKRCALNISRADYSWMEEYLPN